MQYGKCLKGTDFSEFDNNTARYCAFADTNCQGENPTQCSVVFLNRCYKTAAGQAYSASVAFSTPKPTGTTAGAASAVLSAVAALATVASALL